MESSVNYYKIIEHSEQCIIDSLRVSKIPELSPFKNTCEYNPDYFLYYHNCEFYLIEYHRCIDNGYKYTFRYDLLKAVIKSEKKYSDTTVYRGILFDRDFRDFRLRGIEFEKDLVEINYLYSDCFNKKYALCNKIKFHKQLINNELMLKNGEKMMNFLKTTESLKNQVYLHQELKNLISNNEILISDYELYKTTEYLIKHLNNKIYDTSKQ